MKFGTIIPLIGGNSLGCQASAGKEPDFHLSYSAFSKNESHLQRYNQDVPFYYIDEGNVPDLGRVDYINTTCPCAGLSMLNTGVKGIDAPQNDWLYESARYVLGTIKPKAFWGENAPGLFTGLGKDVVKKLISIGREYGYSFSMIKTNTQLHGIPQRRFRTFYFFWDTPTVPILNWKNRKHTTLLEYLEEIPKDATHQDWYIVDRTLTEYYRPYEFVLEHLNLTHPEFAKRYAGTSVAKFIHENDLVDQCIEWLELNYPNAKRSSKHGKQTFVYMLNREREKIRSGKGFWDSSPKFYGDIFGPVIKRNMKSGAHPIENRFLNVREALHLMGMPHDFQLKGQSALNHIAQNVPVKTAMDWADEVKKFIHGELKMSNKTFLKQDNVTQKIIEDPTYLPNIKYETNSVIGVDASKLKEMVKRNQMIKEQTKKTNKKYTVQNII